MTQIFVVSGTTQTSPVDWNNSNNTVEGIGAGGSGATETGSTRSASGGGGGEYRRISNFSVATPGTTAFTYVIGAGGTSVTAANTAGNAGADVTFNSTSLVAKPGQGGAASATAAATGGAGGTGGTGAAANFNGGRGGTSSALGGSATGGGGAAGSTAAGNAGVDTAAGSTGTNGGSADNGGSGAGTAGSGATGATPRTGGNGGNGTEWAVTPYGSGGGGGGGKATGGGTTVGTGGTGGFYGGGGGAAGNGGGGGSTSTSGAGKQGILVLTYTPVVTNVPAYVAHMGITNFDTNTSYSGSHTINVFTKALVAAIRTGKTPAATGPTYGGVAMTLIATVSNSWLFYYINNPLSGAQTFAMTTATDASWWPDDGGAAGGSFDLIELSQNMSPGAIQSDTVTPFSITVGTSGISGVAILGASRSTTNSSPSPTLSGTGIVSLGTAARGYDDDSGNFQNQVVQWGYAPISGTPVAFSCNAASNNLHGFVCNPATTGNFFMLFK